MTRTTRVWNLIFSGLFILLFIAPAQAQLCTGSLGDPVVNINFGTAASPGLGFTAPPGYTFDNTSCPNDGYYTFTSFSSDCFGGNWHTVRTDHTGGGAFMLVNASYQPADFFVSSVSGLCPNTNYQFSAWVMNINKNFTSILPNLTFRIESPSGTVLATYNSGDIQAHYIPTWEESGFYFSTSAGLTDVVLRITNNAPGGIGNDICLDDITFRPCGPSLISSIIGNSGPVDVCEKDQIDYHFTGSISPGFNNPVYQWQVSTDSGAHWTDIPGANTNTFTRVPGSAGAFWYRLASAESGNSGISSCRIASNVLKLNVHTPPLVNAGPDRTVMKGNQITLQATATGEDPLTYNWSPPDFLSGTTELQPVFTPGNATGYQFTASTAGGCFSSDSMYVTVVAGVFVPTAFSPNGDGVNDHWKIPYLDPFRNASVSVFDRWGNVVYKIKGAVVDWDGTMKGSPQPVGTYVYLIQFPDKTPEMKGTFQLIR